MSLDKESVYQSRIQTAFPELPIHSTILDHGGQNNDILIVNEKLIFRFPKYFQGIEDLRRESKILSTIRHRLSLPTPHFIYQNLEEQTVGQAFVGYQIIPGQPLWTEVFAQMKGGESEAHIAKDLASFLYELHTLPAEELIGFNKPPSETLDEWSDIYRRIWQMVFPHLSKNARSWAKSQFDSFLENPESFDFTPVLRHGDFGTSNILYNSREKRISGIIDFGHTGIFDPGIDFAGLYVSYGESFLHKCCRIYPQIKESWERIHFYGTIAFGLIDALFCVENGSDEATEVIAELNSRFG